MAKVRVAEVSLCRLSNCNFSEDSHLLMSWRYTDFSSTDVVAISYTWGEFNRTDVVIGHDNDGKQMTMQLGEEWERSEFIRALAGVCESETEPSACWLDQLCINQDDDEELRRTIAQIPQIYRSFQVVALMPGRPCRCLDAVSELARELRDLPSYEVARASTLSHEMHSTTSRCLNTYGMSSYFDRVWTRQELMYSSSIRVIWTAREDSTECVQGIDDLHHLPKFAALKLQSYLDRGDAPVDALGTLRVFYGLHVSKAIKALAEYGGFLYNEGFQGREGKVFFAEFASGATIRNGLQVPIEDDSLQQKTSRFVSQLGRLGTTGRHATKPCDYVASVWVDCPGYVLPVRYKAMRLSELLDDAIRQLERHTGFTLAANLPRDLASDSSQQASSLWYPGTYLDEVQVESTDQVYGVLSQPHLPISIARDRTLPLLAFKPQFPAIGSCASEYLQGLGSLNAVDAFEEMLPVVDNWPLWVLERAIWEDGRLITNMNHDESGLYASMLLDSVTKKFGRPGTRRFWRKDDGRPGPNIDHHDAVYKLVCRALNLDPEVCKRRDLRLLVCKIIPACIGLTKRPLDSFVEVDDGDLLHQLDPKTTRTICMTRGTQISGSTLVDAVEEWDERGTSYYRIVTIWVPVHTTPFHNIGAIVDTRGRDGFLGCPIDTRGRDGCLGCHIL